MARKTARTKNAERHADTRALAESGRAPQAVHRHMATESTEASVCVEERNAVGPESSRKAKAASAP